ncbi:MAG: ribosome-associated translation inhibitor RaiA [Clostridia bacterium]|nr:ribosome-associated translation inhibitor RaiA [Clostridia bacterium]
MKTTIVGRKCTPKESFKDHAEKKLAKIDKFFGGDGSAKITASVNKNNTTTVELTVQNNGLFFRSQATDPDMTAALDKCVDSMIRQIRKNKTKVEKKIKSGNFDALIPEAPAVEEEVEYKIERQKNIVIKPQTVDEAILQMNLLEHDFYLFENIDTGDINVVYARKEGGYGLLEPEKE